MSPFMGIHLKHSTGFEDYMKKRSVKSQPNHSEISATTKGLLLTWGRNMVQFCLYPYERKDLLNEL